MGASLDVLEDLSFFSCSGQHFIGDPNDSDFGPGVFPFTEVDYANVDWCHFMQGNRQLHTRDGEPLPGRVSFPVADMTGYLNGTRQAHKWKGPHANRTTVLLNAASEAD